MANVILYDDMIIGMSLVLAAHNDKDIVIGWDSLSTYRDMNTGEIITPPEEAQKVIPMNQSLAIMITGTYGNDKMALLRDFKRRFGAVKRIEPAFKELYAMGDAMVLGKTEGFRIGLAGYTSYGRPTFRFIQREHGNPLMDYVEDYALNYYLSGIDDAVDESQVAIKNRVDSETTTADVERIIKEIIDECIPKYPSLGSPSNTLVLHKK